jgi:hypothetical protein
MRSVAPRTRQGEVNQENRFTGAQDRTTLSANKLLSKAIAFRAASWKTTSTCFCASNPKPTTPIDPHRRLSRPRSPGVGITSELVFVCPGFAAEGQGRISARRAAFCCRWCEPPDSGAMSCKARRATQESNDRLICVALRAWVPARMVSGGLHHRQSNAALRAKNRTAPRGDN